MAIHLYVKQHQITKLKYFGMTRKSDIESYHGSGKYWLRHINKHGINHVITLQIWSFEDEKECEKFAIQYSLDKCIVESKEWANLQNENGKDGNVLGSKHTSISLAKMSATHKGRVLTEEDKRKKSLAHKGRPKSAEHREAMSRAAKGKVITPEWRAKISESNKGRIVSIETRKKNIGIK